MEGFIRFWTFIIILQVCAVVNSADGPVDSRLLYIHVTFQVVTPAIVILNLLCLFIYLFLSNKFTTCTNPIIHLFNPPKICIGIVFYFP